MIKVTGQGVVMIEPKYESNSHTVYGHVVIRHNKEKTAMLVAKSYLMKLSIEPLRQGDTIYFKGILTDLEGDDPVIELTYIKMVKRKYVSKVGE